MLDVLNGAQNDDLIVLQNKVASAMNFTKAIDPELDGKDLLATYAGDEDAQKGRDFLKDVGVTIDTVKTVEDARMFIKENVADEGDPITTQLAAGETIVLTNSNNQETGGVDNVIAGDGDDLIIGSVNATNPTYALGDVIDGGKGTDTLYVTLAANSDAVNVSNVEVFNIRATAASTFDASAIENQDQATFNSYKSTANLTIDGVDSLDAKFGMIDTTSNLYVKHVTSVVSGTDDTITLTLDGVGTSSSKPNFYAENVETVNVISIGDAKNYLGQLAADNDGAANTVAGTSTLKKVIISGDQAVEIGASNALNSSVTEVDASQATGDVTVYLSGSATKFTGGSGDDTVDYTNVATGIPAATTTIDGGEGIDTLVIKAAPTSTLSGVTNIENVKLNGLTGAVTLDASKVPGIEKVILGNLSNNNVTISNAPNTVEVLASTSGNVNVTAKEPNSEVTLIVNNKTITPNNGVDLTGTTTVNNAKTLIINSIGGHLNTDTTDKIDGYEENSITNLSTSAGTLKIIGDTDIEITTTDTDIKTVDASEFTGNARIDIQTGTDKTITTGVGKDVVTLGTGKSTVSLGDGDDIVVFSSAANLTKDDVLDGGEGTDAIAFSTNLASGALTVNFSSNPQENLSNVSNFEKILAGVDGGNFTLNLADDAVSKFGGNLTVGVYDDDGDGTIGDGNTLIINASNVNNSNAHITFDGSNVTGAMTLTYTASLGIDEVTGTKNNDTVNVTHATLSSSDSINAGAGTDILNIEIDDGGTSPANSPRTVLASQLENVKGFETVQVYDNASTSNIKLVIDDSFAQNNHDSNYELTIKAYDPVAGSDADDNVTIDASAVSQVKLKIEGGSGDDTIKAGAGNDVIKTNQGTDKVDISAGGADKIIFEDADGDGAVSDEGTDAITGFVLRGDSAVAPEGMDKIVFKIAASGNFDTQGDNQDVAIVADISGNGTIDAGDIEIDDIASSITAGNYYNLPASAYNEISGGSGTIADNSITVIKDKGYADINAALADNGVVDDGVSDAHEDDSLILIFYNTSTQRVEMYYVQDTDSTNGNDGQITANATLLGYFTDKSLADVADFGADNFALLG